MQNGESAGYLCCHRLSHPWSPHGPALMGEGAWRCVCSHVFISIPMQSADTLRQDESGASHVLSYVTGLSCQ